MSENGNANGFEVVTGFFNWTSTPEVKKETDEKVVTDTPTNSPEEEASPEVPSDFVARSEPKAPQEEEVESEPEPVSSGDSAEEEEEAKPEEPSDEEPSSESEADEEVEKSCCCVEDENKDSYPKIVKNEEQYLVILDKRVVGVCADKETANEVIQLVINRIYRRRCYHDYNLYTYKEEEDIWEVWGKYKLWVMSYDCLLHRIGYIKMPRLTLQNSPVQVEVSTEVVEDSSGSEEKQEMEVEQS